MTKIDRSERPRWLAPGCRAIYGFLLRVQASVKVHENAAGRCWMGTVMGLMGWITKTHDALEDFVDVLVVGFRSRLRRLGEDSEVRRIDGFPEPPRHYDVRSRRVLNQLSAGGKAQAGKCKCDSCEPFGRKQARRDSTGHIKPPTEIGSEPLGLRFRRTLPESSKASGALGGAIPGGQGLPVPLAKGGSIKLRQRPETSTGT